MMCKLKNLVEFLQNSQSCAHIFFLARIFFFKLCTLMVWFMTNILMYDSSKKFTFYDMKFSFPFSKFIKWHHKQQFFVHISASCFMIMFKLYTRFLTSNSYILMWVSILGYWYFQKKWLPKSRFLRFFPNRNFDITSEWSIVSVSGFLLTLYHIRSYTTMGGTRHSSFWSGRNLSLKMTCWDFPTYLEIYRYTVPKLVYRIIPV